MVELSELIFEAYRYIKLRKYLDAALIYERIGKTIFKADSKSALDYFRLAIKYYLKSVLDYNKNNLPDNSAKCYENIAKLYRRWLKDSSKAVDYFMAATKYRMISLRSQLDYFEEDQENSKI